MGRNHTESGVLPFKGLKFKMHQVVSRERMTFAYCLYCLYMVPLTASMR